MHQDRQARAEVRRRAQARVRAHADHPSRRVGRHGSGGSWVCDPAVRLRAGCLVYSVGFEGTFEAELEQEYGCEVHRLPAEEVRALPAREDRRVDVLRVDCGGCEWATYTQWPAARQVLVTLYCRTLQQGRSAV